MRIKTSSTIGALSGTTLGTGTGYLVTIGSSYGISVGTSSITLLNYTASSLPSGKLGWAVAVSTPDHGTCYEVISLDGC